MGSNGEPPSGSIRPLPPSVVSRIAAGEIIVRPANALKEMLENSLDSGATKISITVKDGGVKMMQIQDNGKGIQKEDLPLVCERYATSKIASFDDLKTVKTFGFRGEALASISHVANLSLVTMTPEASFAHSASYQCGQLLPESVSVSAGVPGTQVTVEDLFYNLPLRRNALRSAAEEYAKIVDVISRYAIAYAGTSISCRRIGDSGTSSSGVYTAAGASQLDAIRSIYGSAVAQDLLPITVEKKAETTDGLDSDVDSPVFSARGFVSSANYNGKKTNCTFFINGRLVDCSPLKRAIEAVYSVVLPKSSKPFAFLTITMPEENVDVNVHPTKKEVRFLFEDSIIDSIQDAVHSLLLESNDTRTFATQSVAVADSQLVRARKRKQTTANDQGGGEHNRSAKDGYGSSASAMDDRKSQPVLPQKMVRTDARSLPIQAFYRQQMPSQGSNVIISSGRSQVVANRSPRPIANASGERERAETPPSDVRTFEFQSPLSMLRSRKTRTLTSELDSIRELCQEFQKDSHQGLEHLFSAYSFVGMADTQLCLVQHQTKLYLVDICALLVELVKQQTIFKFGKLEKVELQPAAPIEDCLVLALRESEPEISSETESDYRQIAKMGLSLLQDKAAMLSEYFSVVITPEGTLSHLPLVLENYEPDTQWIPHFLLSLVSKVDWEEEKTCFRSVAEEIGNFHTIRPSSPQVELDRIDQDADRDVNALLLSDLQKDSIQNTILPAVRDLLKPPTRFTQDGTVVKLTSLEALYRVFERC